MIHICLFKWSCNAIFGFCLFLSFFPNTFFQCSNITDYSDLLKLSKFLWNLLSWHQFDYGEFYRMLYSLFGNFCWHIYAAVLLGIFALFTAYGNWSWSLQLFVYSKTQPIWKFFVSAVGLTKALLHISNILISKCIYTYIFKISVLRRTCLMIIELMLIEVVERIKVFKECSVV